MRTLAHISSAKRLRKKNPRIAARHKKNKDEEKEETGLSFTFYVETSDAPSGFASNATGMQSHTRTHVINGCRTSEFGTGIIKRAMIDAGLPISQNASDLPANTRTLRPASRVKCQISADRTNVSGTVPSSTHPKYDRSDDS